MAQQKNERVVTMVWIVTYKDTPTSKQREITRYTHESAKRFARLIEEEGGLAVITEDTEDTGMDDFDTLPIPPSTKDNLTW